ncbi:MAG: hypothetical protein HMLKMBBP_00766 [Planctomycetes bacterium]|nr:hypothetical protein [Planctomycetota bacterium]
MPRELPPQPYGPVKTAVLLVLGVALPVGVLAWRFMSRMDGRNPPAAQATDEVRASEIEADRAAAPGELRAAAAVLAKAHAKIRAREASGEPLTHEFTDSVYAAELAAPGVAKACGRSEFGSRPVGTPPRWAAIATRESADGDTVVLLADPAAGDVWRTSGGDLVDLEAAIVAFVAPPPARWTRAGD